MKALIIALTLSWSGSAPPPGYRAFSYPEVVVAIRTAQGQADAGAARIRARYRSSCARVEARLGRAPARPPLVIEAQDGAALRRALVSLGVTEPPSFAAAVAIPAAGAIVIDASAAGLLPPNDPPTVLAHEIAHIVIRDIAQGKAIPRWFEEGVASWVALGDPPWPESDDIAFLAWRDRLYRLEDLETRFPRESHRIMTIAYLQSHAFVRWLEERGGRASIGEVIARVGEGTPFADAIASVYGRPLPALFASFRVDLARSFQPLAWVVRSFSLFTLMAILALAAIVRHRVIRRRRIAALGDGPEIEETAPPEDSRQNGSRGLNSDSGAG